MDANGYQSSREGMILAEVQKYLTANPEAEFPATPEEQQKMATRQRQAEGDSMTDFSQPPFARMAHTLVGDKFHGKDYIFWEEINTGGEKKYVGFTIADVRDGILELWDRHQKVDSYTTEVHRVQSETLAQLDAIRRYFFGIAEGEGQEGTPGKMKEILDAIALLNQAVEDLREHPPVATVESSKVEEEDEVAESEEIQVEVSDSPVMGPSNPHEESLVEYVQAQIQNTLGQELANGLRGQSDALEEETRLRERDTKMLMKQMEEMLARQRETDIRLEKQELELKRLKSLGLDPENLVPGSFLPPPKKPGRDDVLPVFDPSNRLTLSLAFDPSGKTPVEKRIRVQVQEPPMWVTDVDFQELLVGRYYDQHQARWETFKEQQGFPVSFENDGEFLHHLLSCGLRVETQFNAESQQMEISIRQPKEAVPLLMDGSSEESPSPPVGL